MNKDEKKQENKKRRQEKHKAFMERIGAVKPKEYRVCKVTKGEHIYNTPYVGGFGNFKYYSLRCECGKIGRWNKVHDIQPLKQLPKYNVCTLHGFMREDEECWACKLKLEPFEEQNEK